MLVHVRFLSHLVVGKPNKLIVFVRFYEESADPMGSGSAPHACMLLPFFKLLRIPGRAHIRTQHTGLGCLDAISECVLDPVAYPWLPLASLGLAALCVASSAQLGLASLFSAWLHSVQLGSASLGFIRLSLVSLSFTRLPLA